MRGPIHLVCVDLNGLLEDQQALRRDSGAVALSASRPKRAPLLRRWSRAPNRRVRHEAPEALSEKQSGPVRATLRIGDGDAQRLRHLDIRQTFNIVKDEGGAVVQRQLVDRRGQRHAQFGLARWVLHARRPVGDRRRVLAVLVERRQYLIERDFVTSTWPVAKLLVGGIGNDPVEPGAEGRLTPERVDLPDHGPERVLHDFLGVPRVSRDAAREAIRAVPYAATRSSAAAGSRRRSAFTR